MFSLVLNIYFALSKVTSIEGSVSEETEVRTDEDQFMSRRASLAFRAEPKRRRREIPDFPEKCRTNARRLATLPYLRAHESSIKEFPTKFGKSLLRRDRYERRAGLRRRTHQQSRPPFKVLIKFSH